MQRVVDFVNTGRAHTEAFLATADKRKLVAFGLPAAVVLTYYGAKVVLAARDGARYLNDDQKALLKTERSLGGSGGETITVSPISTSDHASAASVLASYTSEDPILIACGKQSPSFNREKREASLRWLYGVLLRSVIPSSQGCIPLQANSVSSGNKKSAVAVWFSKGAELSLLQIALQGGWQYLWRYSGWDRRG